MRSAGLRRVNRYNDYRKLPIDLKSIGSLSFYHNLFFIPTKWIVPFINLQTELYKISQHVSILEETTFQMSQLYLNLDLIIIPIIP